MCGMRGRRARPPAPTYELTNSELLLHRKPEAGRKLSGPCRCMYVTDYSLFVTMRDAGVISFNPLRSRVCLRAWYTLYIVVRYYGICMYVKGIYIEGLITVARTTISLPHVVVQQSHGIRISFWHRPQLCLRAEYVYINVGLKYETYSSTRCTLKSEGELVPRVHTYRTGPDRNVQSRVRTRFGPDAPPSAGCGHTSKRVERLSSALEGSAHAIR